MDWGLMSMEGENKFLRDEIVYSNTVSYLKYQKFSLGFAKKGSEEVLISHILRD